MEINVKLADGMKVNAYFNGFTVCSDQPVKAGGEGSAPDPFSYFLVGIANCAGFFVQRFCRSRDIATDDIEITLRNDWNQAKGCPDNIFVEIHLPPAFPDKYKSAVIRAVNECSVKKTIVNQVAIQVETR
jgi:uncharacterized OsmC-like protein